ncbi:uncharacterized protein LOC134269017 [Saccostrea cucullata]|uniref:uncharacterized protein LOC134269017 n=1 Tax=Saccostrea cuccullata TaxID=36930 RepID=UPI002ED3BF1E
MIELGCIDCKAFLCPKCFALAHNGHRMLDLEIAYNESFKHCQKEMFEIQDILLPQLRQNLQIKQESVTTVKKQIKEIRSSMRKRADEIIKAIETIFNDNNSMLERIEKSVLGHMDREKEETEDYISYLEELSENLNKGLSSEKASDLITFYWKINKTPRKAIPENRQAMLPKFQEGKMNTVELEKQFGKINMTLEESEEALKISKAEKIYTDDTGRCNLQLSKQTVKVRNIDLSVFRSIFHITRMKSGNFWASDSEGNLNQFDPKGKLGKQITTGRSSYGYHAVTNEGELLYAEREKKAVFRLSTDMMEKKIIDTMCWVPQSIYTSKISGDILVGMGHESDWEVCKLTRFSTEGIKFQDIQKNEKGENLFKSTHYITENINGDICTSDTRGEKVVVVTKSGKHRFSYDGHQAQLEFQPCGICTDVLGHILVCNGFYGFCSRFFSIHLMNKDGRFLGFILRPQKCPGAPNTLCIDGEKNLWLGTEDNSSVLVYKYLENKDK